MNNSENTQLGDNPKYYIEVTSQDRNRAAQVYNQEAQLQLYIDKESSHRYVSDDLNMMITFLQRLADSHVELTDSNVGEHMDDMESDFELEEKKGTDKDGDGDIDSDDYLLTRDQAIKNAMKGKKIKTSQLKELVKRAISEQPMGMGGQAKGAVQLPKASNPADIKKLTDKGVDVKLAELELKHFDYTDEEGKMAMSDLLKISKYAIKLFNMLEPETQLEAWVQAKLTKASDYLSSVFHYLEGESILGEVSPEYKPTRPAPMVGDLVGNTVQGFGFRVLSIEGEEMRVEDEKTGIKFMTNIDNMYPQSMNEDLSGPEFTPFRLENLLIDLNQDLSYYLHKGGEADLRYAEFLKEWIAEVRAELSRKIQAKKKLNNNELTEASVPENIKKFAKEKGISSLVNKVASWAERVGSRITGGTAIGKNYDTLVLDMGYQTSDIYIDIDDLAISLYGQPANSFEEFKEVYMEQMTADEIEKDKKQFDRERGLEETYDGLYFIRVSPETFKRAVELVRRSYPRANITIESPDTFRTKDIQTAEDLIMDFGVNDIKLVQDNLNDFGNSQEKFDDIEPYQLNPGMYENKSTCCMRCGRKHVKGTSCPKPYLTESNPRHCKNRK